MSDAAPWSFVEAAAGLAPLIRSRAEDIEQSRRLPLALFEAITQAGLFRLWIPLSLGGEETDPMTLVRVVEEVSRADGAAGWCVAIGGEMARSAGICRPSRLVKSMAMTRESGQPGRLGPSEMPQSSPAAIGRPDDGRLAVAVSILPGSCYQRRELDLKAAA